MNFVLLRCRLYLVLLCGLFAVSLEAQVMFEYQVEPTDITYDVDSGVGSGAVSIFNFEDAISVGFPNLVGGWAMSLSHDPALLETSAIEQGDYIQTVNQGNPPDFWSVDTVSNGFTIGTVYSFIGAAFCTYEVAKEIAVISYQTVPSAFVGDFDGETTLLVFMSLGTPPVSNVVVSSGVTWPASTPDGIVNLSPHSEPQIARGDANANGVINPIGDSITALNYLFVPGNVVDCIDALDCNDDGDVNLGDPILLLLWGFANGQPLPPPFPDCGDDPTIDSLTCAASGCP